MAKRSAPTATAAKTAFKNDKNAQLEQHREDGTDQALTTNQGTKLNDNQNSLKAGERGPTLLEDFIMREKITHFDHERIPERIVHARGAGAHGFFEPYDNAKKFSRAAFLQDPKKRTPVFVRFSTVAGFRGSSDLARDVRGFATKFYTEEGNFDLVGNNIPVFFIQDAIKFPDLIHSVKPEPHNEIPQAASAHDTFWDFIGCMPEAMHMIMWAMSDRAIPRSYRMMEGFGVHTFRFIDAKGVSRFVKFHWKPKLGTHAVVWDEALKISGADPDFHRRDLFDAIENGDYPEWELGVQVIEEKDEHKFGFDILDPTKLIPEEMVPVQKIGRMVLDRNPDNYFAETEQVAFLPSNIVPGIDFSNDPLLQGRLFSYLDTQLKRLGGPNFHEIPINRPTCPMHNNQRDGHMRQMINKGRVSYEPNTLGNGCPFQAMLKDGGFNSFAEKMEGQKVRGRSKSFLDHYSQARLFFDSQAAHEQQHMINALSFELGKCENETVRTRVLYHLDKITPELSKPVAENLGMSVPKKLDDWPNKGYPADADPKAWQDIGAKKPIDKSPSLSMANTDFSAATRMVAILAAPGVDGKAVKAMQAALKKAGAVGKVISVRGGEIDTADGDKLTVAGTLLTEASVLYDAIYVPGGEKSIETLRKQGKAVHFINEMFSHCKAICATAEGVDLVEASQVPTDGMDPSGASVAENAGVLLTRKAAMTKVTPAFIDALAAHRHWSREATTMVPA
ncbi:MAG: catalase HPII [Phycisphaerae bacterium]|nr:catalase HPII [Phycisphaerae bacterium]